MIKGGANTLDGLYFEEKVDLYKILAQMPGYSVQKSKKAGVEVYFEGELVARCFRKHEFYKFLDENNIQWRNIISKRILPDDSLLFIDRETLFIIEILLRRTTNSVMKNYLPVILKENNI